MNLIQNCSVIACLWAFVLVFPCISADEAPYSLCSKEAGGVDSRLKACEAAELASNDARLNDVYRRLLAGVGAGREAQLRAAERAWINFRDAECDFRTSIEVGGSDAALLRDRCLTELTNDRTESLAKALDVASF
jgi:uncharacterized protein YecT (DUF1311 family)